MTTQTPLPPGVRPGTGRPRGDPTRRLRVALTAAVVIAVLAVVALLVVVLTGDDTTSPAAPAPTATPGATATAPSEQATVTPAPTVTSTVAPTPAPPVQVNTATAVWPVKASAIRYSDPVAAARGFASDFAGFRNPLVGRFLQGDSRSGEVQVRPRATGPVTTVIVRQLEDGNWWVLGAATEQIRLDSPVTGELIASPLRLTGAAQAFEGHVTVTLREDGVVAPLANGYVTGRMDEMGPFDGQVTFEHTPSQTYGALLLTIHSAENGELWQAAVIRVQLRR